MANIGLGGAYCSRGLNPCHTDLSFLKTPSRVHKTSLQRGHIIKSTLFLPSRTPQMTFFWRRVHVTFTLFEAHFAGKLNLTGGQTPLSHLMGCMAPQDVATSPSSVTLPDLHGQSFLKKSTESVSFLNPCPNTCSRLPGIAWEGQCCFHFYLAVSCTLPWWVGVQLLMQEVDVGTCPRPAADGWVSSTPSGRGFYRKYPSWRG